MLDVEELAQVRVRGLRRSEFDKLAKLGAFTDENVELLRGQIVAMTRESEEHYRAGMWLARKLIRTFGDDEFEVRHVGPLAADDESEPIPDLSVGRPRPPGQRDYPSEVLLLVEVSKSSIRKDRGIKRTLYAEIGVPEYWIIDQSIEGQLTVEVYTDPTSKGYESVTKHRDGDIIRPKHVPIDIAVSEIPR